MKAVVQRVAFRVIQDQVMRVSPFPSPLFVTVFPYIIDYVVTNNYYIRAKKCKLLTHPRKIVKTIPTIASADIINSDIVAHAVDNIHDKNVHDVAHAFIIFLKYALIAI